MNEEQEGHIQRKLICAGRIKKKKKEKKKKSPLSVGGERWKDSCDDSRLLHFVTEKCFFPQSDAFEHPEESSGSPRPVADSIPPARG